MELNYYDFLYESKMEYFYLKEEYFNAYDFGKEKDTNITLSSTNRNFKDCKWNVLVSHSVFHTFISAIKKDDIFVLYSL